MFENTHTELEKEYIINSAEMQVILEEYPHIFTYKTVSCFINDRTILTIDRSDMEEETMGEIIVTPCWHYCLEVWNEDRSSRNELVSGFFNISAIQQYSSELTISFNDTLVYQYDNSLRFTYKGDFLGIKG